MVQPSVLLFTICMDLVIGLPTFGDTSFVGVIIEMATKTLKIEQNEEKQKNSSNGGVYEPQVRLS